ncbi:MAG: hypothetical protein BRC33_06010 [Cyanobacteria bacterium SW_9_44_58]|nr:MAG: hypothetical protein BRC33_06010 [Cyanobacteria bacterium SW_9_44_58]
MGSSQVDVTSKTQLEAYLQLGVPELWVYEENELKIYILESNQYQQKAISPTFLQLPIPSIIAEVLDQSRKKGRSPALRNFRKQIEAMIET